MFTANDTPVKMLLIGINGTAVFNDLLEASYINQTRLAFAQSHGEALQQLRSCEFSIVIIDDTNQFLADEKWVMELRNFHRGWIVWVNRNADEKSEITALNSGVDICFNWNNSPELFYTKMLALCRNKSSGVSGAIYNDKILDQTEPATHNFISQKMYDIKETEVSNLIGKSYNRLSNSEQELLRLLMNHSGFILNRDFLHLRLLGFEWDGIDRAIDQRVARLRKNLKLYKINTVDIISVRGVGYMLEILENRLQSVTQND